ncbi:MAG: hypothetical protein JW820_20230 [Spirochaetales bacterium]|nr:hypothetical protein [Spirochaetales bacterium]
MHLFDQPGPQNTETVLRLTRERGEALGIRSCIVASNRGRTARKALDLMSGFRIVMVTHCTGFREPNFQELPDDERARLQEAGIPVLTATHPLGALGRAVRNKLGTYQLDEIIAYTLRIFGQGLKVAVEIALMAADAGLIPVGQPVLSVGGTGEGADTAAVLLPTNTHSFFDLQVREIICKPAAW